MIANYDYIKELAHSNWVRDGKPNGEKYIDSKWGRIKIKDYHWKKAEEQAEVYLNHGPGGDW